MRFSVAFGTLSVKDPDACGGTAAVGNGVADDTTAIQNCLNLAFGTYASPHSHASRTSNRAVYFPPGTYLITKPLLLRSVEAGHIFGAGNLTTKIQYSGPEGAILSSGSISGTTLTCTVSSGSIPIGGWLDNDTTTLSGAGAMTLITAQLTGSAGGSGTYTVSVSHPSVESNGTFTGATISRIRACIFVTNGFAYNVVEDMNLDGGDVNFLYNWDNTGDVNGTGNVFRNIGGGNSEHGFIVGKNGYQCDDTLWEHISIGNFTAAGIYLGNANALNHTVIGGRMDGDSAAGSSVGYHCDAGCFTSIIGASCHTNLAWVADIGGRLPCHLIGVRTEGRNFVTCSADVTASNCIHAGTTDSVFLTVEDPYTYCVVENCISSHGEITGNANARVNVRNSIFGRRSDWLTNFTGRAVIENVDLGRDSSTGTGSATIRSRYERRIVLGGSVRTFDIEAAALTDYFFAYETPESGGVAVTFTLASPIVFTCGSHGLVAGSQVALINSGDTLPSALSFAKTYYVISAGLTTSEFELSLTDGGAAINHTIGAQSGTHMLGVVRTYATGDQVLNSNISAAGQSPGWVCSTAGPSLANNAGTVAVFRSLAVVT